MTAEERSFAAWFYDERIINDEHLKELSRRRAQKSIAWIDISGDEPVIRRGVERSDA